MTYLCVFWQKNLSRIVYFQLFLSRFRISDPGWDWPDPDRIHRLLNPNFTLKNRFWTWNWLSQIKKCSLFSKYISEKKRIWAFHVILYLDPGFKAKPEFVPKTIWIWIWAKYPDPKLKPCVQHVRISRLNKEIIGGRFINNLAFIMLGVL